MLSPIGHEVLHDLLQSNYCIEFVKLFNFGKRVWVRISCQIYNQMDDYVRLGNAVYNIITQGHYMKELLKRASTIIDAKDGGSGYQYRYDSNDDMGEDGYSYGDEEDQQSANNMMGGTMGGMDDMNGMNGMD